MEGGASSRGGREEANGLPDLWWGMFLATSSLGNAVGLASWRATTAQEMLLATRITLFADAFGIVAAFMAVILVCNATALQHPVLVDSIQRHSRSASKTTRGRSVLLVA